MKSSHFIRLIAFVFASFTAIWVWIVFPVFRVAYSSDQMARAIARGAIYDPDKLLQFDARLEQARAFGHCSEPLVWDRVLVKIAIVNALLQGNDAGEMDARVDQLNGAAHQLIECSPRSGIAWLIAYWVEIRQNGLDTQAFDYLRASYRLAPREGWICLRRSRFIMPIRQWLPEDVRRSSMMEFDDLIRSGFTDDAVDILAALDRKQRRSVVAALDKTPSEELTAVKRGLQSRNLLDDLGLPTRKNPERPWEE